jgi:TetR/AcrR family transcriptional regulator
VRAAVTREKIERAAMQTFSEMSYEAASTREIAKRAGVHQQLITYHYRSKLGLWKATVDCVIPILLARISACVAGIDREDAATRVRVVLREFMLFNAERPEVVRFVMHEGATAGPRLDWLFQNHTRHVFAMLRAELESAQENGLAPRGDPDHLTAMFMGCVAVLANRAEFALITEGRSENPEALEKYTDLVLRTLLPGLPELP